MRNKDGGGTGGGKLRVGRLGQGQSPRGREGPLPARGLPAGVRPCLQGGLHTARPLREDGPRVTLHRGRGSKKQNGQVAPLRHCTGVWQIWGSNPQTPGPLLAPARRAPRLVPGRNDRPLLPQRDHGSPRAHRLDRPDTGLTSGALRLEQRSLLATAATAETTACPRHWGLMSGDAGGGQSVSPASAHSCHSRHYLVTSAMSQAPAGA